MSPAFLLTALVVVLAPGARVIYTLSTGLTQGARAFAASFTALGLRLALERA